MSILKDTFRGPALLAAALALSACSFAMPGTSSPERLADRAARDGDSA